MEIHTDMHIKLQYVCKYVVLIYNFLLLLKNNNNLK